MKKCPLCNVRMKHGFCPECGLSEMMAEDALPYCAHLPKEKHRHREETPRKIERPTAAPERKVRASSLEQTPATPYGEPPQRNRNPKKAQVGLLIAGVLLLVNLLPLLFSAFDSFGELTPVAPIPESPRFSVSLTTDTLLPIAFDATPPSVALELPVTVWDSEEFTLTLSEIEPLDYGDLELRYELINHTDAPLTLIGEGLTVNGFTFSSSLYAECPAGERVSAADWISSEPLYRANVDTVSALKLRLLASVNGGELTALAPITLGEEAQATLPNGPTFYEEKGLTFSYLGCEAEESESSIRLPRFWFAITNHSDHPISISAERISLLGVDYDDPGFFCKLQPGDSAVNWIDFPVYQEDLKLPISLSKLGTVEIQFELMDTEVYETLDRFSLKLITDF